MRISVVDTAGVTLMPCTPPEARKLLKEGKAHPKCNKLGSFHLQLTYTQELEKQLLVVGIDPKSLCEGYRVVGTGETVLNLMAEAAHHVKDAVETRRTVRCARRFRYRLLSTMEREVQNHEGWQTKERRDCHGLSKAKSACDGHPVDAWVLAANVGRASNATCTRLWNVAPARLGRRRLHALQPARGGMTRR